MARGVTAYNVPLKNYVESFTLIVRDAAEDLDELHALQTKVSTYIKTRLELMTQLSQFQVIMPTHGLRTFVLPSIVPFFTQFSNALTDISRNKNILRIDNAGTPKKMDSFADFLYSPTSAEGQKAVKWISKSGLVIYSKEMLDEANKTAVEKGWQDINSTIVDTLKELESKDNSIYGAKNQPSIAKCSDAFTKICALFKANEVIQLKFQKEEFADQKEGAEKTQGL